MPCLNNPVSWKRLNSVFSDVEPEAQSSAGASCGYWTGSAGRVGVTLLLTPTAPVAVSEIFTCERRCCRGMPRQALEQRVLPVIFPAGSDPRTLSFLRSCEQGVVNLSSRPRVISPSAFSSSAGRRLGTAAADTARGEAGEPRWDTNAPALTGPETTSARGHVSVDVFASGSWLSSLADCDSSFHGFVLTPYQARPAVMLLYSLRAGCASG